MDLAGAAASGAALASASGSAAGAGAAMAPVARAMARRAKTFFMLMVLLLIEKCIRVLELEVDRIKRMEMLILLPKPTQDQGAFMASRNTSICTLSLEQHMHHARVDSVTAVVSLHDTVLVPSEAPLAAPSRRPIVTSASHVHHTTASKRQERRRCHLVYIAALSACI